VPKTARLVWLCAAFTLCAAVIILIIAVVMVVLPAESRRDAAGSWVEHTHQVIIAIDDMLASAADAETGQRGFLLTADARFLEPYDRGTRDIWRQFSIIQDLTADNSSQQSRLMVLHGQLSARLAELAHTIDLARNGNSEAALDIVRSGEGKALMDPVRITTADMTAEENRLLLARRAERDKAQQASNEIFLFLVASGTLGILVSAVTVAWAAVLAARARSRSAATTAERLRLLKLLDLVPVLVRDLDGTVRFWSEGCHSL
jgi:CHASE3 domain sensor protein